LDWIFLMLTIGSSLAVAQHGHEPPGLVVPHEDDDLVLGNGFSVVGRQYDLRLPGQVFLEFVVPVRIDPLTRKVEQHNGSFDIEFFVERTDKRQMFLGGSDQIIAWAYAPCRF
jgi:hypothetical protein